MSWLFTNGNQTDSVKLQWAPLLTSHDPNPPIALEGVPSQQILPSGISSGEAFGVVSVSTSQTASPSGIASSESFGSPSISISVAPSGIASAEQFGSVLIQTAVSVFPSDIPSGSGFGSPSILVQQLVLPSGISSLEAFGSASVFVAQSIFPSGVSSGESFGSVLVLVGQNIFPIGITSGSDVGTPLLVYGQDVFPSSVLSVGLFGTPSISTDTPTPPSPEIPTKIYSLQVQCGYRVCQNSPDVQIYSLQDALFFNGTPLSFLIQCPTGQVCPPGTLPRVFTYPPGTFSFPQPPPGDGSPVFLQMTGCRSVVSRTLPSGSTTAEINQAAQDIINEVAQQQAECDGDGSISYTLGIEMSDLPTWACRGSLLSVVVTGFVPASARVPNPSLWDVGSFNFSGNSQPIWMSASESGDELLLTGTPDAFGLVSFTIQASAPPPAPGDPWAVGQKTYNIEIIGISPESPLDAVVNEQYDQVFSATGFGSTPTWGIAYGTIPPGLTFNPFFAGSAALTGIPTEEGDFTFAIFVQDGERQCVKEYDLSVQQGAVFNWNDLVWIGDDNTFFNGGGVSISGSGDTVLTELAGQFLIPPESVAITRIYSDGLLASENVSAKAIVTVTGMFGQIDFFLFVSSTPYPASPGDLAVVGASFVSNGVYEYPFSFSGPTQVYVLAGGFITDNNGFSSSGFIEIQIVNV